MESLTKISISPIFTDIFVLPKSRAAILQTTSKSVYPRTEKSPGLLYIAVKENTRLKYSLL